MNSETTPHPDRWQFSLANVMVFMFAVALWFLIVTKHSHLLAPITFVLVLVGIPATYTAWRRKLQGILVLLFLFEVIVVVTFLGGEVASNAARTRRYAKLAYLTYLSEGMNSYYGDWNAFPPPPTDPNANNTELARFMFMPRKADGMPYASIRPRSKSSAALGGTGNVVVWTLPNPEAVILIDVGEDGLAGKYTFDPNEPIRIPSDANGDGVDDADDDTVTARTADK